MTEDAAGMRPADESHDLLVVGGGINGAGIARDAAGRGLKVLLAERDDLAAHTSSASTKLIHGGLRYLEYREFRLVRESLQERERLIHMAPHISGPMRFVLPHLPGGRPSWMIRAGLWFYDHIGGRQSLPGSRAVDLSDPCWGAGLKPGFARGFAYSDAWVDDARLVVLNALDAAERGATILTGTEVMAAVPDGASWRVTLSNGMAVRAKTIVNTAGPWAGSLLDRLSGVERQGGITLVKGSHLIVRRFYAGDHAFLLQQPDGRIVFTIPYQRDFTLVGTTDVRVDESERAAPQITPDETEYLCAAVNRYFVQGIGPKDVVSSYSGVRPLFDDGKDDAKAITRDYVLQLGRKTGPQVLSVFGGKLTTYRRLAEHVLNRLAPWLPRMEQPWTDRAPLPGGDLPDGDFGAFLEGVRQRWPFLPAVTAERMARAYGTRIDRVLNGAVCQDALGMDFGSGLTEAELRYLVRHEWARCAADVLWRRTKLGLTCSIETKQHVERWFADHGA